MKLMLNIYFFLGIDICISRNRRSRVLPGGHISYQNFFPFPTRFMVWEN